MTVVTVTLENNNIVVVETKKEEEEKQGEEEEEEEERRKMKTFGEQSLKLLLAQQCVEALSDVANKLNDMTTLFDETTKDDKALWTQWFIDLEKLNGRHVSSAYGGRNARGHKVSTRVARFVARRTKRLERCNDERHVLQNAP